MSHSAENVFALAAHWAIFFNSCINPVIYNFMSGKNQDRIILRDFNLTFL